MTTATAIFTAAFADYAPVLAAEFVAYHTRVINRLIQTYEGNLRGLMNMGSADGAAYRNSRSFIAYATPSSPLALDRKAIGVLADRLQQAGDEYANAVVAEFIGKLAKKLGALTEVKVLRANSNGTFVIVGNLADREVSIEQQKVCKVSTKGLFFHQWPARIYVDGKFTPEAAFKKLAA